tara:strand:+ start:128 stop:631 length:504 start_codon:yes stop_codon:yes gene_type:complete
MAEKKNKNNNLFLWEQVETTDPEFTSKVNQRGGFTAIGAQYQFKNATEIFGAFGHGFGVKDENYTPILNDTLIVYTATFYYKYEDEAGDVNGEFPISSSIRVMMGSKLDDDCIKKVQTDAITKGLSRLGFNADVFMGRFDGNKYVDANGQKIDGNTGTDAGAKDEWI